MAFTATFKETMNGFALTSRGLRENPRFIGMYTLFPVATPTCHQIGHRNAKSLFPTVHGLAHSPRRKLTSDDRLSRIEAIGFVQGAQRVALGIIGHLHVPARPAGLGSLHMGA